MRALKTTTIKNVIVRTDNSLDKYEDMPLFEDKVAKANKILNKVGLPKKQSKNFN